MRQDSDIDPPGREGEFHIPQQGRGALYHLTQLKLPATLKRESQRLYGIEIDSLKIVPMI